MSSARSPLLQTLAQRIQEIEASSNPHRPPALSLDVGPLDELLPAGRLPAGSLVELLAATEGAGAGTLALLMAKHVCGEGKILVVVDDRRWFYPPAAAFWGIQLDESLIVRPRSRRETLLATDQALRCSAVGAVVARCDQLAPMDARRLQLAAEAGGGAGFLLRPREAANAPSFAQLRLRVAAVPPVAAGRCVRVEVVRCRVGKEGASVLLEVSDEAGHVRVLPPLAPATAAARAARASG